MRVIWAYNDRDATSENNILKHQFGQNGVKSLILFSTPRTTSLPKGSTQLNITHKNVRMSIVKTIQPIKNRHIFVIFEETKSATIYR